MKSDKIRKNLRLFSALSCPDLREDERLEKIITAIENGADITAVDKNTNETVLQTAENKNYLTIIEYLAAGC